MYLKYTITVPHDLVLEGEQYVSIELGSGAVGKATRLSILGGIDTCASELALDSETMTLKAGTYDQCRVFIFDNTGGNEDGYFYGAGRERFDAYRLNPVVWDN